jgi:hypothetical protein
MTDQRCLASAIARRSALTRLVFYVEGLYVPNNDDGKIEQVPPVPQVGASVHDESVCYNLHHTLPREDHQEHVLYFLLQSSQTTR